jgi:hypothetical protein
VTVLLQTNAEEPKVLGGFRVSPKAEVEVMEMYPPSAWDKEEASSSTVTMLSIKLAGVRTECLGKFSSLQIWVGKNVSHPG